MRSPTKTTAIVLAAAVGLSSVAFGVGTQVDGGSSAAASRDDGARQRDNGAGQRGFVVFGPGDLAQELRVDADALGEALRDYHEQERSELRSAFATALADALGKSTADVESALPKLERPRGYPFAVALHRLAAELDVTRAELRRALREVRDSADLRPQDRRDELVQFLAERFNLSEDEVDDACPSSPAADRAARPVPTGRAAPGRMSPDQPDHGARKSDKAVGSVAAVQSEGPHKCQPRVDKCADLPGRR